MYAFALAIGLGLFICGVASLAWAFMNCVTFFAGCNDDDSDDNADE